MLILGNEGCYIILFDCFLLFISIISYYNARWINVIYNDEMECYQRNSKEERQCRIYILIGVIFIIFKLVYDVTSLFRVL